MAIYNNKVEVSYLRGYSMLIIRQALHEWKRHLENDIAQYSKLKQWMEREPLVSMTKRHIADVERVIQDVNSIMGE